MDEAMSSQLGLWDVLSCLVITLVAQFGHVVKMYGDEASRKWLCTIMGLILLCFLTGVCAFYLLLWSSFTIIVILNMSPRYCHIAAFISMFSYLVIFRFPYFMENGKIDLHMNFIQGAVTLSITGIAFEIHQYNSRRLGETRPSRTLDDTEVNLLNLSFADVFHYVFNYATLALGPYIRYQVYVDFIKLPFSRAIGNTLQMRLEAFVYLPIVSLLAMLTLYHIRVEYIWSPEFATQSLLHKLNFSILLLFKFRMVMYTQYFTLCTMVKNAGFGAYPVENKSVIGYGPTVNNNNFRKITYEEACLLEYDFETIHSMKIVPYEMSPKLSNGWRMWNRGVQYWLRNYIYLRLPEEYFSKTARVFVVMNVSALWHTLYPGLYIAAVTQTYYMLVEAIWFGYQKKFTGWKYKSFSVIGWICQNYFRAWSYSPYVIMDTATILHYYKLTYYSPMVFTAMMHAVAVLILPRIWKTEEKNGEGDINCNTIISNRGNTDDPKTKLNGVIKNHQE